MPTDYQQRQMSPFDLLTMIAQGSRVIMETPLGYTAIVRGVAIGMCSQAHDGYLPQHHPAMSFMVSIHQHPGANRPQIVCLHRAPDCCKVDTIEELF